MTVEQLLVIGLLFATIVMLMTQKIKHSVVAMIIVSVLTVGGVLSSKDTMAKLADPTIMLYVGSFVLSAAFGKVGLTGILGGKLLRLAKRYMARQELVLFILAILTAFLSIFLQALGVQIVLMTLILAMADELGMSRKKALFALGFSATIGGTFTLLGNNVDLLAKSAYEASVPGGTFGMFEMSPFTIPSGLVLITFWAFVTSRWMKDPVQIHSSVSEIEESVTESLSKDQWCVLGLMGVFLGGVFLDKKIPVPSNVTVIIVLLLIGFTGIMDLHEIINSINWNVVLFAVGIMTLSSSVVKVGIGDLIAGYAAAHISQTVSLRGMVAVMFLSTTIMTQFMSNGGSFGIMAPLAITLGNGLGLPVKPLIIAVCVGANGGFATPMATPSYPMLQEAGNITFREFASQGGVMVALNTIMAIVFIPIIWG